MRNSVGSPLWNAGKRTLDVAAVLLSAPVVLPIALTTAILVRTSLGSPVIFRQRRIGLNEREFDVLKFRTMSNATDNRGNPLSDSERLTSTGRWLRKLSLDELPQLFNVLRGEMSIVGPRPLFPRYLRHYSTRERLRHFVRPGITGRAQVDGRNELLWNARLELDVRYVETQAFRQDLAILMRTVKKVLGGSGVSVIAGDSGEPLDVARSYPVADGITIRRFERADIPARVRWMNDPRTREHMQLPTAVSEESTVRWLQMSRQVAGRYDFTATAIGSDEPVAMLGLTPRAAESSPELYVFVDPARHGQRLGSRSLAALQLWMSRENNPHACWLSVDASNKAAIALYRGMGFVEANRPKGRRLRMEFRCDPREEMDV